MGALRLKQSFQQEARSSGTPWAGRGPKLAAALLPQNADGSGESQLRWEAHKNLCKSLNAYQGAYGEQGDAAVLSAALSMAKCALLSWTFFSTGDLQAHDDGLSEVVGSKTMLAVCVGWDSGSR